MRTKLELNTHKSKLMEGFINVKIQSQKNNMFQINYKVVTLPR